MAANRLAVLVPHDVRLQLRNGIYYAYAFVIGIYVLMLWQLGQWIPSWLPAITIYTDPAVLGFFFMGALMLLEKAENTRTALAITPMAAADYFWSKTITLTGVSTVAIFVLGVFLPNGADHLILLPATILTSIQFIGVGVFAAMRFKTVTSYLIGAAGYLVPIFALVVPAFFNSMPWIAMLWPPAAQFRLTLVATGAATATSPEYLVLFASSLVGATFGVWLGIFSLKKEMGRS